MKRFLSLLLALSLALTLVACDNTEYEVDVPDPVDEPDPVDGPVTLADLDTPAPLQSSLNYRTTYPAHYETLNYLESQSANDNEYTANMIDGLVEVNRFNQFVPALASDWSSEIVDGKKFWNFHILWILFDSQLMPFFYLQ